MLTEPIGRTSAAATSTPRKTRNSGLMIFPIHVRMPPGRSEKKSTAAKNSANPIVKSVTKKIKNSVFRNATLNPSLENSTR